jgi:sugar transferase EpsL
VTSSRQPGSKGRPAQQATKRVIDVTASTLGLLLLSPVLLVLALLVRTRIGSPVLFRQQRLGLYGRPFTLLKFRTMVEAVDSDGVPLSDEERMTRLGRFLRSTSLDELPELFNVLRGEMSLVGPRPLLPQYRELYTPFQWRRHEVKPGIAGPVAAGGRNILSWEDKFRLDVDYVTSWSLWLDLKLLGRTFWRALTRRGVSQPGRETVEFFRGSQEGEQ